MSISVSTPTPEAVEQATSPRYKWLVLANTTVGVLLATIDSSIMLIALPQIFRGLVLTRWKRATLFTCFG